MDKPSVSVVMPLYNKASQVRRAIDSILRQGVDDLEVVVVDDGSSDDSAAVVEAIGDHRVRLIRQKNAGVSAARNKGIAQARGEMVAFLDADDEWLPGYLATINRLRANNPQCEVFATKYVYRYQDGRERQPIIRGLPEGWEGELDDYFGLASKSDPPVWSSAVTVSRQAIDSVGGFPVGIRVGEDILTWARLAKCRRIAYSTEVCAVFHFAHGQDGRPRKLPDVPDLVGEQLKQLAAAQKGSTRDYYILWLQMRWRTFLDAGSRRAAVEALRVLSVSPASVRGLAMLVLAMLPSRFSRWLLNRKG